MRQSAIARQSQIRAERFELVLCLQNFYCFGCVKAANKSTIVKCQVLNQYKALYDRRFLALSRSRSGKNVVNRVPELVLGWRIVNSS